MVTRRLQKSLQLLKLKKKSKSRRPLQSHTFLYSSAVQKKECSSSVPGSNGNEISNLVKTKPQSNANVNDETEAEEVDFIVPIPFLPIAKITGK